jgi:tRNA (guanine-N7-)-methyltransferase
MYRDINSRRWINPYVLKRDDHSDRIFSLKNCEITDLANQLNKLTSNYKDIVLELGSGSGGFIIKLAQGDILNATCFIGFELRYKRAVRTIEKAKALNLDNVFIVMVDASLIGKLFLSATILSVYINFPDPWTKGSWRKNRLIKQSLIDDIYNLLIKNGTLSFKTDAKEYFSEVNNKYISATKWETIKHTNDLYNSSFINENIQTEFEQLFCSKKVPINLGQYIRIN